jgi:hypothetical protein
MNHPGREIDEMKESCALDVADRGGVTLVTVGQLLGVSMERARQIERMAAESADVAVHELRRKTAAARVASSAGHLRTPNGPCVPDGHKRSSIRIAAPLVGAMR